MVVQNCTTSRMIRLESRFVAVGPVLKTGGFLRCSTNNCRKDVLVKQTQKDTRMYTPFFLQDDQDSDPESQLHKARSNFFDSADKLRVLVIPVVFGIAAGTTTNLRDVVDLGVTSNFPGAGGLSASKTGFSLLSSSIRKSTVIRWEERVNCWEKIGTYDKVRSFLQFLFQSLSPSIVYQCSCSWRKVNWLGNPPNYQSIWRQRQAHPRRQGCQLWS